MLARILVILITTKPKNVDVILRNSTQEKTETRQDLTRAVAGNDGKDETGLQHVQTQKCVAYVVMCSAQISPHYQHLIFSLDTRNTKRRFSVL